MSPSDELCGLSGTDEQHTAESLRTFAPELLLVPRILPGLTLETQHISLQRPDRSPRSACRILLMAAPLERTRCVLDRPLSRERLVVRLDVLFTEPLRVVRGDWEIAAFRAV